MHTKTTAEMRRQFYFLHQQGQTYPELANRFCVSVECVRYWCRKQRDGLPVEPKVRAPSPQRFLCGFHPRVRFVLLRLKLEHPRWGVGSLRMHLRKRPSLSGLALPSEASLGRYLHQWSRFRRSKRGRSTGVRPKPPQRVHQRWQIDFKSDLHLPGGQGLGLHTVRDPYGEACMGACVYAVAPGPGPKPVRMEEVRSTLRHCFAMWHTLPEAVQTDGESVLVGKPGENFPTTFTLWLQGLGIQHEVTRPFRPTDNAEVERCHQTVNNYAVIGNQACSPQALQMELDQAVYELAFELPSRAAGCAGQTPVSAHPELLAAPRPYAPELEASLFDLAKVDAFLASFTWQRKVDVNGVIYLRDRYSLGRDYRGQYVKVRFDPSDRQYVCFQEDLSGSQVELRRWPARHLSAEELLGYASGPWPLGTGPQQLPLPFPRQLGVNS